MRVRSRFDEPNCERLLLIELEPKPNIPSDYRHISATVVRRAVADVKNKEDGTSQWWDGVEPIGYRNTTWSCHSPVKAVYVDGLQLRGQIDAHGDAAKCVLNKGRPYGNEITFRASYIEQTQADAMSKTFAKLSKAKKADSSHDANDFTTQLFFLAKALGISRFIFHTSPYANGLLASKHFVEYDFSQANKAINKLLQPFYKD